MGDFNSPIGNLEDYFVTDYWLIDQYIGSQLWVWGNNNSPRLGANDNRNRSTPITTFAGGNNWKQVATGYDISFGIKTDGSLWTWGNSTYGALGIGSPFAASTPVTTFAGGNNWKQVSCGYNHVTAIKTDGSLWTWGLNISGQLGTNDTISRSTPVTTFAGGNDWKQVSSSSFGAASAAIKIDGSLWIWGGGTTGALGNNRSINICTPITTFSGGNDWKQVSCGSGFWFAIKNNGTLWYSGGANSGQSGTNLEAKSTLTPITTFAGGSNWKKVFCGTIHVGAIKTDGSLWVWGSNSNGRLGVNDTISRSTPVTTFAGGNDWKSGAAGGNQIAAIKTDGSLWTWGYGIYGNIGNNRNITVRTPVTTFAGGNDWKQVRVGTAHVLAITTGDSGSGESSVEPAGPLSWEMLLVAGGGGTRTESFEPPTDDEFFAEPAGGGGGGGGVRTTSGTTDNSSSLYITIGGGGASSPTGASLGGSTYYTLTSEGLSVLSSSGGGSGSDSDTVTRDGGSGGGGCAQGFAYTRDFGGEGTPGQGNDGGYGYNVDAFGSASGGGGGGWGSIGGDALNGFGGHGGSGYNLATFAGGSNVYLGWGGGGGGQAPGDNGDPNNLFVNNAPPSSGGGGRGRLGSGGGAGGSGRVVIRYVGTNAKATGGTITYQNVGGINYVIHTFTASDIFTVL
jgi:alpha-tubulin suppressor-like RCC1 family protein